MEVVDVLGDVEKEFVVLVVYIVFKEDLGVGAK
jgi:hypothetical protein